MSHALMKWRQPDKEIAMYDGDKNILQELCDMQNEL